MRKTKNVRIGGSRILYIVEKAPEAKLKSKTHKASLKITPILIFNDRKLFKEKMNNNRYFGENTRSEVEMEDQVGILGIQFQYVMSIQLRKIYANKGLKC